jgi:integrase
MAPRRLCSTIDRVEGRQRRITIGSYPDWSVQAAREAAKTMKRDVDRGHDPMGERHNERTAPTVQALWERYKLENLSRKAARSQADERSMWEQIILPRFGKMKVASITHDEIDALHRDITAIRGTPVRANRTIEVLRTAFNLAIRWKWSTDNPATGVRRNPEERRNRYFNRSEMMALAQALNQHGETTSANALKLLMLTGARRGEVLSATWNMFDLENGVWTKPSSHTKQRRLHRVPLSGPALQLLLQMKEEASSAYVFPGADGKPLTDIKRTWGAVCRNAGLAVQSEKKGRDGKVVKAKDGRPVMRWQPRNGHNYKFEGDSPDDVPVYAYLFLRFS